MKYLCLAYYDEKKFEALPPDQLKAIESGCPAHDAALKKTGRLVMQASLGLSKDSVSIRPKNGRPTVTDGPFTETKELAGGFFIIEATSREEAIRVASEHPAAHLGEQVGWGIEVRPIDYYDGP